MRFNKFISLFSVFLVTALFYSFAAAADRYDSDVGQDQTMTTDNFKGGDFHVFKMQPTAFEPAPALVRHNYLADTYCAPKSKAHASIWNARINSNYQYQLPGKAGPPFKPSPLRE